MKKTFLSLLLFVLISNFSITPNANAATNENIEPIKTEQITLDDGTIVPIYYFKNPEDGDKHRKQMAKAENTLSQWNLSPLNQVKTEANVSPFALGDRYTLLRYGGTLRYNYDVQYTYNATNSTKKWAPTVSRSTSSETSINVHIGFKNAFKAEVGKVFNNTTKWSHAFDFNIPAKKQYEIWSWNIAENWTFRATNVLGTKFNDFSVYRPTSTYGHAIYKFDSQRDPR